MEPTPGIKIIQESEPENTTLPSLKATILTPKVLIIALIISVILNLLLLCAVIFTSTVDDNTAQIQPTRTQPSPTPIITTRPSPGPTLNPEEENTELKVCFRECSTDELISKVKEIVLSTENFKSTSSVVNETSRNCYKNNLVASGLDSYNTYSHFDCSDGYPSNPPNDTIQVGDTLSIYNPSTGNWTNEVKSRSNTNELVGLVNAIQDQPTRNSSPYTSGSRYREITSTGEAVNPNNQLIETQYTIIVNEYLEISHFEVINKDGIIETGSFYDLGMENNIQLP